jgi:uncharacterized protein involved in response to NO
MRMTEPIQITEPQPREKFSIFSYGFRPFFLAAGIYTILPLVPWLLYLNGLIDPTIPLQSWHAHEMLFGFVAAGISGFLLTAIPSWTNTPPANGNLLRFIFSLWLAGRIAFWLFLFFDHPIFGYLLFLDLMLPFYQAVRIAKIFIKTGSKRNYIFIGIMAMLGVGNCLVILDLSGITSGTAAIGAIFAPNIIFITLAVIGGRVVPNFTRGYLKQKCCDAKVCCFPKLEILAIWILILSAAVDLFFVHTLFSSLIARTAFAIHLVRFSFWQSCRILGNTLLWPLHLGYIWLIIALFLKGTEYFFDLPYNLYLHAFTIGAVGTNILGIMTRAALGHTGRPMRVKPIIAASYIMITFAATIRITTPFYVDSFLEGMNLTSILWVTAFAIYLWVYVPILISPRIDGKPG